MHKHILIQKNFSQVATPLRKAFDVNFENPRSTHQDRFVWDYWHVPNQYTALRTPAWTYFQEDLYMQLHEEIVLWGRRNLGCWDISPPWMTCYVEGCKQELHSDVPHGPWAFVFSLTPAKKWSQRKFTGGETRIFKPSVLNYWQNFSESKDRELHSFVDHVESPFNQLTVFDPRYPHGVTEVRGTQNPAEGRLVIHGWFTEPKTYLEGPLNTQSKKVESILDETFDHVVALVQELQQEQILLQGVMSLQLQVLPNGQVESCHFATCNVLDQYGETPKLFQKELKKIYLQLNFPKTNGKTLITLPLILS